MIRIPPPPPGSDFKSHEWQHWFFVLASTLSSALSTLDTIDHGPAPAFITDEGGGGDGEMGPPGVPGVAGAAGATGPAGPMGFGMDGLDGDDGQPIPGARGATGPAGSNGFGLDGEDGQDGMSLVGPQGTAGSTGSQGPTGPAIFLVAEDGEDGMMGPPGASGATGGSISGYTTTPNIIAVDTTIGSDLTYIALGYLTINSGIAFTINGNVGVI